MTARLDRPSEHDLRRLEVLTGVLLSDGERPVFQEVIDRALGSFDRVDELWGSTQADAEPREPGRPPTADEDPYGAWTWRCSLRGGSKGALVGRSVAVKDNIAVAGMPMTGGSSLLESFIPETDATVVTRILDAGGEITGKAACEALCVSGGSHTSFPQPVRNPRNPAFMAGGSSSGSAALLAAGMVDLAVGGDQAGSIRIPASWCGVVGLKPTFGLVPYTGILPLEPTFDHVGPMAGSVAGVALLLEVLAGRDGLDPRQIGVPTELPRYAIELETPAPAPRIGVVAEGFGWPGVSEADVDETVRTALAGLAASGVDVRDVSIPWHRDGMHVWNAVAIEGVWSGVVRDHFAGYGTGGPHEAEVALAFSSAVADRPSALPPLARVIGLLGAHLSERYRGRLYAIGQNLRPRLAAAYDRALDEVDVLAMPTTCWGPPLLDESVALEELLRRTVGPIENTCPFDITGHPAISVPCGSAHGLPVGLMLIGRRFDESTVLRAAEAVERAMA
ncbi:MAG: amidase [Actinomycetota bacterium]